MSSSQKNRILVVDDDASIRDLIAIQVRKFGYEVVMAEDGQQAIDIVNDQRIDLVLMDLMMPNVNGFEALSYFRKQYDKAALPVILITARDGADSVVQALRLGANDYIAKPIPFAALRDRIEVHLALKSNSGKVLGNYRINKKLGEGGMGDVYRALDVTQQIEVALKILPRSMTMDEEYVLRFLREGRLASQIKHPNLVRIYNTGKVDQTYFIAMEFIDGDDLRSKINHGRLSVPRSLGIARQITLALGAIGASGVVHRDVKPGNVLLDRRGVAHLTDFGIAREANTDSRMTQSGVWMGSPIYSSPEQLTGKADIRSDFYSLGCTLFAMLTATDPFSYSDDIQALYMSKRKRPPDVRELNKEVPKDVSKFVARLMSHKPNKRPSTHKEVVHNIDVLRLAYAEEPFVELVP